MYTKDKSIRFNVRLSEEQYQKIERIADSCGTSVSGAFRIIIDSYFKEGQVAFLVMDGENNED